MFLSYEQINRPVSPFFVSFLSESLSNISLLVFLPLIDVFHVCYLCVALAGIHWNDNKYLTKKDNGSQR